MKILTVYDVLSALLPPSVAAAFQHLTAVQRKVGLLAKYGWLLNLLFLVIFLLPFAGWAFYGQIGLGAVGPIIGSIAAMLGLVVTNDILAPHWLREAANHFREAQSALEQAVRWRYAIVSDITYAPGMVLVVLACSGGAFAFLIHESQAALLEENLAKLDVGQALFVNVLPTFDDPQNLEVQFEQVLAKMAIALGQRPFDLAIPAELLAAANQYLHDAEVGAQQMEAV